MNWSNLVPTEAQSIASSTIFVKYQENFPVRGHSYQFDQRSGKITGLPIAVKIFLESGMFDKRHLLHRTFYQIGHVQETDTVSQKGEDGDLIGRIHNTGEIASFPERFGRQRQIAESAGIRFFESQGIGFTEIIPRKIAGQPSGEA